MRRKAHSAARVRSVRAATQGVLRAKRLRRALSGLLHRADAQKRADAIRREIQRLGLPGDINVEVEGSRVKVTGDVPDEATRQKLTMIVGNVKYIEAVDDTGLSGVAPQARQPKVHEVQSGDTLSAIAKQHYGDANAYQKIFAANQPMLKDPDDIYPGQVLIIPEQAGAMA